MHHYNVILSEIFFMTFLLLIFGIWFLIILEIIRNDGSFLGIKGIVLSLLIAALVITMPMLLLQPGYNTQETTYNSYFNFNSDHFAAIIVGLIVITLVLMVTVAVRFANDKDDDPDNEITESTEKSNE